MTHIGVRDGYDGGNLFLYKAAYTDQPSCLGRIDGQFEPSIYLQCLPVAMSIALSVVTVTFHVK